MSPKTPDELREQLERENEEATEEGKERTAEGLEVEPPTRETFFSDLERASKPRK
ncbi:MAG: hypothetical protein M3312_04995 [Actinomycetota bacterium]|nr:hypothetical protein [Actinomycetota bacterium]